MGFNFRVFVFFNTLATQLIMIIRARYYYPSLLLLAYVKAGFEHFYFTAAKYLVQIVMLTKRFKNWVFDLVCFL